MNSFEVLTNNQTNPAKDASDALMEAVIDGSKAHDFLLNNYKKLDANKGGTLSKNEIDRYMPENGMDSLAKAYSLKHFDDIKKAGDLQILGSNISREDIIQYGIQHDPKYEARQSQLDELAVSFERNFDKLDKNKKWLGITSRIEGCRNRSFSGYRSEAHG